MPSDGNSGDGDDEERTYREYKLEKNPRAHDPDDAGPRDPGAEMREEAGIGTGFEALEGDGDVEKSMQETLEGVVDDVDFLHLDDSAEGEERVKLSLTQADIEEARQSPDDRQEALLRGIQGELHALRRELEFGDSGGGSGVSKSGDAADLMGQAASELGDIEDRLERQEGEETVRIPEEDVQGFEDLLNLYVEAEEENSLNDSGREVLEWMLDQAGEMEGEARRQVYAALASVQSAEMEQSETLV